VQGGAQVAQYFARIWRLRYFWLALVKVDLKNRYRRSLIGVGWSLLHPILMTIVLATVFGQLFHRGDVQTYAPFLLSGLIFWSFIATTMNLGCHCFFQGESYIRQHPAPLAIYSLRTTLGAAIHFGIGMALVMIIIWFVNGFGNLASLPALLPSLLLVFILGWSLATLTGVMNVMFQDCQHLIEVLLQVLFYLTPIMYEPRDLFRNKPEVVWYLKNLNPFAVMLDLLRDPILYAKLPPIETYGIGLLVAAMAASAASFTLLKIEKRMVFYL
jgi:lipopolysaccharide transport system permease protein